MKVTRPWKLGDIEKLHNFDDILWKSADFSNLAFSHVTAVRFLQELGFFYSLAFST